MEENRPALSSVHGAQDSPVPVRNGCIPDAPDGEHVTQAGTLIVGVAGALPEDPPEDPPELPCDEEVDRALPVALGWLVTAWVGDVVVPVEAAPVPAAPEDTVPMDTVPEPPVVAAGDVAGVDGAAAAAGLAVVVDAVGFCVPMPTLTTPLTVTVPGVTAV